MRKTAQLPRSRRSTSAPESSVTLASDHRAPSARRAPNHHHPHRKLSMTSTRRTITCLALTATLAACTKSDKAPSTSSTSASAAATTVTPGAVAPSSGLSAIDEAALRDFRLSDEKIAHTIQATDNIGAL